VLCSIEIANLIAEKPCENPALLESRTDSTVRREWTNLVLSRKSLLT